MRRLLALVAPLTFAFASLIATPVRADLAPRSAPKKGGCDFGAGGTAGFLAVATVPGIALALVRRRRARPSSPK